MKSNSRGLTEKLFLKATLITITISTPITVLSTCGKLPSSETSKTNVSLELSAPSQGVDSGNSKNVKLRANGYDSVGLVAKVRGLSGNVGFYIADGWGSFPQGTPSDDGFTYFTTGNSGKVSTTLVAGFVVGKTEITAKSLSETVTLTAEFSLGALAIYPSNLTLQDSNGAWANVRAIGGAPPIAWSSSNPAAVYAKKLSETEARVFVHDSASFDSKVTIYAVDTEGSSSSISVLPGATHCVDANFALSNNAPKAGDILSVTLDDFDRAGLTSVEVTYSGSANGAITLSQWITQGVFKGYFNVPVAAVTGDTYTFSVVDQDSNCNNITISRMATVQ